MNRHLRQYDLLRELGRGHFGAVYLAVGDVPGRGSHPPRRSLVAIKTLHEGATDEHRQILRQEFSLLEQVKHRAIVRVHEYLDVEDAVVMEVVRGVTLRTVLDACAKRREQVFTEAAIEIGCELADALYQGWTTPGDNGERLQLVHRDLKPENVMLTPDAEVRILDYGLARVGGARESRDHVRGTPIYMAPEQARGEDVDHRTDLFALGLILYELLTGQPAYRIPADATEPLAATWQAIEAGDCGDACRELERKLPAAGPIVARLLQARPRNRYPSGQDLLVDLRRQLYKDRGAYLKEFCGFFFGTVCPPPELPELDMVEGGKMTNDKPQAKTMEDRLKASIERQATGDPVDPGRAPVPVRRAPLVVTAAENAKPPPPKITARPSARPPPVEDDPPPSVRGGAPSPRSPVGARRPDETGMLPMSPLGAGGDQREAAADPTATSFFAIPAPKAERPRAAASPTPSAMGLAQDGAARPMAAPPVDRPAFTPPPPVGAASIMSGPPSQPMIQGPVVSYGAGQPGAPFGVTAPAPPSSAAAESRMQSTRVFALVLLAFFIVCTAMLAAVGIWVFDPFGLKKPEAVAVAPVAPTPPPAATPPRDTGTRPKAQAPTRPKATPKPDGGGAPVAKPGATAGISVTFSGDSMPTSVEVECQDGTRQRKSLAGGSASFSGVPSGVECKIVPKGVVANPYPARAGRSYSCVITGTTTSCK